MPKSMSLAKARAAFAAQVQANKVVEKALEDQRERGGVLFLKSGLAELLLDDDVLLTEFRALAQRFRVSPPEPAKPASRTKKAKGAAEPTSKDLAA